MKSNFYLIFPFLLPVIFILINVYLIHSTDKRLTYETVAIKYIDLNSNRKDVGIRNSQGKWGVRVFFLNEDSVRFERRYHGILNRINARIHSNRLIEEKPSRVSLYIDKNNFDKDSKNSFFNLGKGKEKTSFYYFDILNFIKYKYYIFFMIGYLVCLAALFFIGESRTDTIYFKGLIGNVILLFLYLIL